MSEKLDVANAYYQVSKDLEWKAMRLLETSKFLAKMADELCESNMQDQPPTPNPGEK